MTWKTVVVAVLTATVFVASVPERAAAAFSAIGTGPGRASAQAFSAAPAPAASATGREVTVTWTAVTLTGGTPAAGYVVRRYDTSGAPQTVLAACTGVATTSCVEHSVPVGTWRYTIQPILGNWTGPESAFSAPVTTALIPAPVVQTLEMRDADNDGRVDRVLVTFDQVLHPAYTAGTAPWTLRNVPSGGSLASVAVSGSTATLTLNEGTGTPNTAVGSFTVAMASNVNGVRSLSGLPGSFAARAPLDRSAPALRTLTMVDANSNGKVDRVTALFSEALSTYTAGTAPWVLSGVPSGGALSAASMATATVTLTVAEGSGPADTAVGAMTVAMSAAATGVRDAAGNQGAFAATAPADGARPLPISVADTSGATNGLAEPGDTLIVTFTEALAAASVPASATVTLADPPGSGNDTVSVSGIANGARNSGSNGYVSANGVSATYAASAVALGGSDRIVTVTLGSTCSGTGCASLAAPTADAPLSLVAATSLRDVAGNAPVTVSRNFSIRLF